MANTVQQLIDDSLQHLTTGQGEPFNFLEAPITVALTGTGGSITLQDDLGPIQPGSRLSIDTELFRVRSVNPVTKTAVVVGGQEGTTATTHLDNALVQVNPKFPPFRILRAMQQELRALATPVLGLWRPVTVDLTYASVTNGYDLTGLTANDVINVHRVQYKETGDAHKQWQEIPGWTFQRGLPTTDFPSSMAVFVPTFLLPTGSAVRVIVRARFGELGSTLASDVEATTGMPERMHDLLSLGAALRLFRPREMKRTFTEAQPEPRRSEEVPPGHVMQTGQDLARWRQARINEEASWLASLYPIRGY